MNDWIEIVVPGRGPELDELAALLVDEVEAARAGVELRDTEIVFWVRADQREQALASTLAAATRLIARGMELDSAGIAARPAVPESEWRDAWKKYFHSVRLTRQVVVVPSWDRHSAVPGGVQPDDMVLYLDPGQAFGTGAHASTQLVLEEIQRFKDDGGAVTWFSDVGTGSGILSIAAARLWPGARGVAVDTDPYAIEATRENADANSVGDRIDASTTGVAKLERPSELVLANIQAHVLIPLREPIARLLAPGGVLVLSGLLTPQAQGVADQYVADCGVRLVSVRASDRDPAWSCVVLAR